MTHEAAEFDDDRTDTAGNNATDTGGTRRHVELFAAHRGDLVGAAYRVLGSVHDAEDVVQDAWLRWSGVDIDTVRMPRAYLLQTVTRLALNRVRDQARRREEYIGPWLPEPAVAAEAEHQVELADDVSMALLVVLAALSPAERAAFVLKEVFGLPYGDIAEALDRSESAVRQLAHRAKNHVHERAPRYPVSPKTHHEVTVRFLEAVQNGSVDELLSLMAPDVTLITDGGGIRKAALRPLLGADNIIRWLFGVLAKPDVADLEMSLGHVNGQSAVVAHNGSAIDSVVFFDVDDGLIREGYAIRNPEKLRHLRLADIRVEREV
ncbi:RNA polymerase sigma factor SigJ [Saxibacter everestensis]|uniref:RNA polymerase sigma factor SigJ n=1 Tax=Saxibacter everestensis TaxID=2909229 RepID=A0ABY8QS40_9MICO|nr:RNA polymerase sigma factor SigJ [Brevibacteriaceae bacterium ZFBP1038]